ncbi:MAG: class II aldolase/adducin family protein [Proteobacteria bacterium]|nr:class II aldolase/adducin family protein [Pseudomonadota bacterium]
MKPQGADALRVPLLQTARAMTAAGLNVGTAGNASVRLSDVLQAGALLITPSGLAAERCTAQDMVVLRADGSFDGSLAPSSEWQLHRDIYAAFPDAGAILHAHAPFATALACQRGDIPPFHYMIARFGGSTIRCARYATFGTQALSDAAVAAMQGRRACLLANHGMVVHGRDLDHALALAIEFETLCAQYWRTCQLGAPVLLSEEEMADVIERFRWYGKPKRERG